MEDCNSKFLIVDDILQNQMVLGSILEQECECELMFEDSGEALLDNIVMYEDNPPDIILLDIMMPDVDGYETAKRLKANPIMKEIPIIFISALSDVSDKVKGFLVGGVDFISKPFNKQELLSRVTTHLKLKKTLDSLNAEILERKRAEEARNTMELHVLAQSKMATLGELATGIAHEINQPLTYISSIFQLINSSLSEGETIENDEMLSMANEAHKQIDRIVGVTHHLRLLGGVEATNNTQQVDLCEIVNSATVLLNKQLSENFIEVIQDIPDGTWLLLASYSDFEQVFLALMINAIDVLKKKDGDRKIWITLRRKENDFYLSVQDNGQGMSERLITKIFDPFFTTKEIGDGSGLGLSIAQNILTTYDGKITCDSVEDNGSTFTIIVPIPSQLSS